MGNRLENPLRDWWSASVADDDRAQVASKARAALRVASELDQSRTPLLAEELSELLSSLESHARQVFDEAPSGAQPTAHALPTLRASSRLLRNLTRANAHPPGELAPFFLQDLSDLEQECVDISGLPEEPTRADSWATDLNAIRVEVLVSRAQQALDSGRALLSGSPSEAVRLLEGSRVLVALLSETRRSASQSSQARLQPLLAEIELQSATLEDRFLEQAQSLPEEACLKAFVDGARFLIEEMDAARAAALEPASAAEELQSLRALERTARRFHERWKAAQSRFTESAIVDEPSIETLRRSRAVQTCFKRHQKRLGDVLSDRALKLRLQRILGQRGLKIWDGSIFWLIVVAIALLVLEHFSAERSSGIGWIQWTDTAICGVLLLDFFVRMLLSPLRLRYLVRYSATELLPSIPFSLLAHLGHLPGLEFLAALRLLRAARIVRALQPVLRLSRLLLFFARAIDRFIENNAWLLNRDLVFFDEPSSASASSAVHKRARDLDRWIHRGAAHHLSTMGQKDRRTHLEERCRLLRVEIEHWRAAPSPERTPRLDLHRELKVEEAIRTLRELDAEQVSDLVGLNFARELCDSLRLLRLPLLRRFSLVSYVVGAGGEEPPLAVTARLGHVIGDLMAWARRVLLWFADLHGTISAAQLVDRLGLQLVRATMRPAMRLILFGLGLGALLILIYLTQLSFLQRLSSVLLRFLSLPVLVLGLLCAVPLALGLWFQRIAGGAADLYERICAAQFGSLTETVKEKEGAEQMNLLVERVVLPEMRVQGNDSMDRAGATAALLARRRGLKGNAALAGFERLLLLHRQFLDGGYFHAEDTKISSLLFGDLSLEEVRRDRLRWSQRRLRSVEKLNIAGNRASLFGPYFWFNCISHSIVHQAARLILEYNRHSIPLAEARVASSAENQELQLWVEHRRAISAARREGVVLAREEPRRRTASSDLIFRTTEFTALHFLTVDADRDRAIEERFGAEICERMREDRTNLIRDVFGTYPARRKNPTLCTFNGYEFYRRYLARGRIFLMPVFGLILIIKGAAVSLRMLYRVTRDLLRPHLRPDRTSAAHADFDSARRKLHRMRRPMAIEALRLRAEFDLEYLGIPIPGARRDGNQDVARAGAISEDLRALLATEREWQEFRRLKSTQEQRIRHLVERITARFGGAEQLATYLRARQPPGTPGAGERLRALATAYVCDEGSCASLSQGIEQLRAAAVEATSNPPAKICRPGFLRTRLRADLASVWPWLFGGGTDGPETIDLAERTIEQHRKQLGPVLRKVARILREEQAVGQQQPPQDESSARKRLDDLLWSRLHAVALRPQRWTDQLLAVRTIQTLTLLDLRGYERQLALLGEFDPSDQRSMDLVAL